MELLGESRIIHYEVFDINNGGCAARIAEN